MIFTKQSSKKPILFLAFLIIIFGVAIYASRKDMPQVAGVQTPAMTEPSILVSQTIYGGVKPVDTTFKGRVKKGTTALDLLLEEAQVKFKGKKQAVLITEINGRVVQADKQEFWAFYVNGKPTKNAGIYRLKNNDNIEWKVENIKF